MCVCERERERLSTYVCAYLPGPLPGREGERGSARPAKVSEEGREREGERGGGRMERKRKGCVCVRGLERERRSVCVCKRVSECFYIYLCACLP